MTEFSIYLGIFDGILFTDPTAFLSLIIILSIGLGILSGKLTIGAFAGFITFMHIVINASIGVFTNFLFIVIPLLAILVGIKIWTYSKSSKGTEL